MLPIDYVELPLFDIILVLFSNGSLWVLRGHMVSLWVVHDVIHLLFNPNFLFYPNIHGVRSSMILNISTSKV